jgi:hypothetical protein
METPVGYDLLVPMKVLKLAEHHGTFPQTIVAFGYG